MADMTIMTIDEITKRLAEPFPADDVEWRVGSTDNKDNPTKGIALAYITNRAIMKRLDDVMGIDNWRNEFEMWRTNGVLCGLSLRINGEWITKWDGSDESDMEAIKGGFSDSMKRAAYQWGIGRYLYDLPTVWVPVEKRGRSTYLKAPPVLPSWALPGSERGTAKPPQTSAPSAPPKPATSKSHHVEPSQITPPKQAEETKSAGDGSHPNKTKQTEALVKAIYVAAGKVGLSHDQVHEFTREAFKMATLTSLYDLGKTKERYMELLGVLNKRAAEQG